MEIRVIITGATGMVGEGVLHECLRHPAVESVLLVNRKPSGAQHAKLKEVILPDFSDLTHIINDLSGYNACFFCLGVSSVGKNEADYTRITYDHTIRFAKTLLKCNPESTFCYVSGAGTDSSETGRSMWARVKGRTENDLLKMPFKAAYMFRPGYIQPTPGLKNTYTIYRIATPFYPVWKTLFPKLVCRLEEIGKAMIHTVLHGYDHAVLENKDIVLMSKREER